MREVSVTPRSRQNIRKFVEEFRKMFGLENETYFPIVQFIEWGLPELGITYEYVSERELGDAYGVTHTGIGIIKIREDVYERAIQGNPRDRFTLCHELGHSLLHTPDQVTFARGEVPSYMDPEWQANVFAGELMAPYNLVRNMSPQEIAQKCGMSLQAAQVQYNCYH